MSSWHSELITTVFILLPLFLVSGLVLDQKYLNKDIPQGYASALEYGIVAAFMFHEIIFISLLIQGY